MKVWIRRDGDVIRICDKEIFDIDCLTVGHPIYSFDLKASYYSDQNMVKLFCALLDLKDGQCYKMELRHWPT